jgi:hypothetical protein
MNPVWDDYQCIALISPNSYLIVIKAKALIGGYMYLNYILDGIGIQL